MTIFPSLISADLLNLQQQITLLDPYCDGYHLDLMDGHFVPNITWGPQFINAIANSTSKHCWVHAMATQPEIWIDRFELNMHAMVDFHIETCIDHKALLTYIRKKNWQAGIAIKPTTGIDAVIPLLNDLDYVVIMSVEPGFSGQQFIPTSVEKIKALTRYRSDNNLSFKLAIDGGINTNNIRDVYKAGIDYCAVASALFSKEDPIEALHNLKKIIKD